MARRGKQALKRQMGFELKPAFAPGDLPQPFEGARDQRISACAGAQSDN
jgi:hypothetical protein